ncbi:MAG: branched-chain amino acid aminotransferase [Bifidobacteriaceae bacterium]|jgi:branched-chain amino acid aminotransferase|nr:branched-chain amino acid aminotransferase [Bifidobacteriaceae bacterium]
MSRFALEPHPSPVSPERRAALLEAPAFGTVFTDHMARITWRAGGAGWAGWRDRRLVPYGPLELSPATSALHYAQEIFEGLKAYRWPDGSIRTFRPTANAERFARSARRLALPELPVEDFLDSLAALVEVDQAWVPSQPGTSLYLRPFMFASEPFIGVRASHEVSYLVIASPVGAYFKGGVAPVSIWVDQDYHRAGPGGTGAAKCGGNYAASLVSQETAYSHGCEQVLFLDAATSTHLEELGGMNVVVVMADGSVVTPPTSGTILEGVTRSSLLQLVRDRGLAVTERPVELADLLTGLRSGAVAEVFACGTAAVVTPVGRLAGADFDVTVGDGHPGALTMSLYEELTGIQYGRVKDRHDWTHRLI